MKAKNSYMSVYCDLHEYGIKKTNSKIPLTILNIKISYFLALKCEIFDTSNREFFKGSNQ